MLPEYDRLINRCFASSVEGWPAADRELMLFVVRSGYRPSKVWPDVRVGGSFAELGKSHFEKLYNDACEEVRRVRWETIAAGGGGHDNAAFTNYRVEDGQRVARVADDLVNELLDIGEGWPKIIGGSLHAKIRGGVRRIGTPARLFAWIQSRRSVRWLPASSVLGGISKSEFFHALADSSILDRFNSISKVPHHRRIEDVLYDCPAVEVEVADGSPHLDSLASFFEPASDIDAALIRAYLATIFWGGAYGSRPLFVIESKGSTYAGKSTLAEVAAILSGSDLIDMPRVVSRASVIKATTSPAGRRRSVVRFDNLHDSRVDWQALEWAVSSPTIPGKAAGRPNNCLWSLVMHGGNVAATTLSRSVFIGLASGRVSPDWGEKVKDYALTHRVAIGNECVSLLRSGGDVMTPIDSRNAAWLAGVLAKVADEKTAIAAASAAARRVGDALIWGDG